MEAETVKTSIAVPRLTCQSRVIALDESTRRVRHVISTATLDRYNRMVDPSGWKLAKFRQNPVVLADHEYNIERIIGRAYETKVENDALVSVTEFAEEGLGNVAFRLVQSGIVSAWSVGWIGLKSHHIGEIEDCGLCVAANKGKKIDYGTHFTQQELLEYSLVAIPANPDAVMGLRTAGLIASKEADEWIGTVPAVDEHPCDLGQDDECLPLIERSSEFYVKAFTGARNLARFTALRQAKSLLGVSHE